MNNFYDPNAPQPPPLHLASPLSGLPEELLSSPHAIYSHYQPVGDPDIHSPTLGHWQGLSAEVPNSQGKAASRVRRRTLHSSDQVKHRRTRSGCYTCRHRRVKCDEAQPVCQRCRKGSRDCVYPQQASASRPTASAKSGQNGDSGQESGSSPEDSDDEGGGETTGAVKAESEPATSRKASLPSIKKQHTEPGVELSRKTIADERSTTETVQVKKEESPSHQFNEPSPLKPQQGRPQPPRRTSSSIVSSQLSPSSGTDSTTCRWSHLDQDLQFYLDFHRNEITFNHYFWRYDYSDFIHTTLIESALSHEALLFAVVAFAAYKHSIGQLDGKIANFLRYYNKSLSCLRKSLSTGQTHTDSTILTVLQLAAFEEYLGDWLNLTRHQTAAGEMIKGLYTPETMVQTDKGRKVLFWYQRFDILSNYTMGNYGAGIGIEWFHALHRCYQDLCREKPLVLEYKVESLFSESRIHALEFARLFTSVGTGQISHEMFALRSEEFGRTLFQWGEKLQPFLADRENMAAPLENESHVDPHGPRACVPLFIGDFWPINYLYLDVLTVEAMFRSQTARLSGCDAALEPLVRQCCQMIEAIERFPSKLRGAMLPTASILGVLATLTPRNETYLQWLCEKFFHIEAYDGFVFQQILRQKMATDWDVPALKSWWMEDESSYPPVVRAVRAFTAERANNPHSPTNGDLEGIKMFMSNLQVHETPQMAKASFEEKK